MTRRRPRIRPAALLAVALVAVAAACVPPVPGIHAPSAGIRLNQIQVLASHNSYHVQPEPALQAALNDFLGPAAQAFEYTHHPLAEELDAGVRQIELDVFLDDPPGRYAHPKVVDLLGVAGPDPALAGPGLKVLHVQEVDFRSTCPTLAICLTQVRDWSDAHPGHLPVTIQIEAKDDVIPDPIPLGFVQPQPWTGPDFATLQAEIDAVFPAERVLTPDEVRGNSATLADAVRKGRWPRLDQVRGQVLFMLDDHGAKRDAYRAEVPDLADRRLFVDVPESDPDAAIMVVNDPLSQGDRIRDLVAAGFIVRTRADADTVQARSGDTSMRDAAFASGAQYVSTDYVFPEDPFGTGYVVDLPGDGAARCNPVSAPRRCEQADLGG